MTDQIADLLVRIRNISMVGKYELTVSFSKMKEAILNILKNEGFIESYSVAEEDNFKIIKIKISAKKTPTHLKQVSKPGHRIYSSAKDIKTPLRGFGLLVVSTSAGIISAKEANKKGLGGELICEVW